MEILLFQLLIEIIPFLSSVVTTSGAYADGKNPGETDYGNALGTVPGNKNDVGSIGDAGNPGSTYANEAAGNA